MYVKGKKLTKKHPDNAALKNEKRGRFVRFCEERSQSPAS
jgi:hypothetical protein